MSGILPESWVYEGRIKITPDEHAALIEATATHREPICTSFGPGGVFLVGEDRGGGIRHYPEWALHVLDVNRNGTEGCIR